MIKLKKSCAPSPFSPPLPGFSLWAGIVKKWNGSIISGGCARYENEFIKPSPGDISARINTSTRRRRRQSSQSCQVRAAVAAMAVAGNTKEQTRKDIITICVRKTFIRTASRVLLFQGRGRRWGGGGRSCTVCLVLEKFFSLHHRILVW